MDAPNSSYYRNKMFAMALNCDCLLFLSMSAMECNVKNSSAPESERNVPDNLCLSLSLLMPLSLPLLSAEKSCAEALWTHDRHATRTNSFKNSKRFFIKQLVPPVSPELGFYKVG